MPPNLFSDSRDLYYSKPKTTIDNLHKPSFGDNPPFIWPGITTHDLGTLNGKYKPLRGYIRRLNEFYKNMGVESSNINNRKCNFQFQPETVVRNVAGNSYDTQYFFNQDPGQLTVPIPGQSTFNIKLLFNREAEVSSNKYLSGNRNLLPGSANPSPTINDSKDSLFIQDFNQSWVTKIGVLADILVLDAVIGQGINSETVSIINRIADEAKKTASSSSSSFQTPTTPLTDKQLDEQDRKNFNKEAAAFWAGHGSDNPNLGNQAFLVPTPVRIVLSNNMMVEGFVLQSAVNFHKFSKDFIPTQATVELSVQALYIGFAKKTTMLTNPIETTDETNGPDASTTTTTQTLAYNAVKDGLKTLYKGSPKHQKSTQDLLKYLLLTEPLHNFSFNMSLTDEGNIFRNTIIKDLTGGTSAFYWSGKIQMWWKQHVVGATNSRLLTRTQASGPIAFENGAPNDEFLKEWGISEEQPYILAEGSGKILEELDNDNNKALKPGDLTSSSIKVNHRIVDEDPGKWTVNLKPTIPKPFEQDKFVIQLTIDINLETGGSRYPIGQSITYMQTVAAGDDVLFKAATFSARKS